MKIIVSTKNLKTTFDLLKSDRVDYIETYSNKIILHASDSSGNRCVEFNCVILDDIREKKTFKQSNVRWDWVQRMLNRVEECPVVIDINDNKLRMIFDF